MFYWFYFNLFLWISACFHILCALTLLSCGYLLHQKFGLNYWMGLRTMGLICLLIYQHQIISEDNLEHINLAFFTTNGIASIFLAVCTILDFYW
ncbi:MAG: hypothetical protein ABI851_11640 [Saprospiraceae bacterium]